VAEHHHEQDEQGSFGKYHFLIRRLHSLSGLIPVGVFLFIHLFTNATIIAPGEAGAEFQRAVDRIHGLEPLLIPVEIVGIFIPLLFHTVIGFLIILTAEPNARQYAYGANVRYTLQRATGVIAFFFILYHVWQMHWMGKPLGGGKFDPHEAANTAAVVIQAGWWIAPLYAIGVLASVFHLANGVWTSMITWGVTIRPRTQRISGYACAAFGVFLALVGMGALSGFRTFNVRDIHAGTRTPADGRAASQHAISQNTMEP